MKINQLFKNSITTLTSNKVRSVLTMLGVIIGVFSVVTLVAIGQGLQNFIGDQFSSLGTNLVAVAPGKVDFSDDPAKFLSRNKLTDKHVDLIRNNAPLVQNVSPVLRLDAVTEFKTNSYLGTAFGGNEDVLEIYSFELDQGRQFTRQEVRSKAKVVILGFQAKKELFGNLNAIGENINIEGEKFEVIGLFKQKNQQFDDFLGMPYTAAIDVFEVDTFTNIATNVENSEDIDLAIKQIELALLRDLDSDDFSVLSQADLLGSIQNILGIVTTGLGAIAGISLVVGGIGIMNIMLVSVTERIKEIGLRKAIGATPKMIGLQFLFEAIILSVTGGTIGLLLAWGASFIIQNFVNTSLSLSSVLVAFTFSVFVGAVFGTYPAISASKKDPIEALRYE